MFLDPHVGFLPPPASHADPGLLIKSGVTDARTHAPRTMARIPDPRVHAHLHLHLPTHTLFVISIKERAHFRDQFAPFDVFLGATPAAVKDFPGTVLRFPLRSPELAATSLIKQTPYPPERVLEAFERFTRVAPHAVLFLRHVRELRLGVLEADGTTRTPLVNS